MEIVDPFYYGRSCIDSLSPHTTKETEINSNLLNSTEPQPTVTSRTSPFFLGMETNLRSQPPNLLNGANLWKGPNKQFPYEGKEIKEPIRRINNSLWFYPQWGFLNMNPESRGIHSLMDSRTPHDSPEKVNTVSCSNLNLNYLTKRKGLHN